MSEMSLLKKPPNPLKGKGVDIKELLSKISKPKNAPVGFGVNSYE
jgi:hypothetical protein